MIQRHSSRRQPLDAAFLNQRLANAKGYDRIAGYFSSSILEVAGEALETVQGPIRVVCNSQLSRADIEVAKLAQAAMRREWCESRPEALGENARPRFQHLYDFLRSGKLEVRVLPDDVFGLIHGKAGVVTLADGRRTAFLGSANESKTAFRLNYELIWEDDSAESVAWVQAEFDALWQSPFAVPLADFVVRDLDRLSRRELIGEIQRWRDEPEPASVVVEAPVYRREVGLWEHQKHFVKLAFDAHRGPFGARFVLADQVGLGKTLQLAMAAQLMALSGEKPVLVLAPKPLLRQWQEEMDTLLGLPSAIWTGRLWVDERGVEHPGVGTEAVRDCPRRIGIVSTSAITSNSGVVPHLEAMRYECVILDEAHRARRRRATQRPYAAAEPNNLQRFLRVVSKRTKSLLLATATPVQLHPVEAYDLLDALAEGSPAVLGVPGSPWRDPAKSLPVLLGESEAPADFLVRWDWMRDPFPPVEEGRDFEILRTSLALEDADAHAPGNAVGDLRPADKQRVDNLFPGFLDNHNPYIRAIVLRTREYLENTQDPETGEPYLAHVGVRLHGDGPEDAIVLPPFLRDAYQQAEAFCTLLAKRLNAGFFRTMLLRRIGSTMAAGRITVARMLDGWQDAEDFENDEDAPAALRTLTDDERALLERLAEALEAHAEQDPKCAAVLRLLTDEGWLDHGCIVFSQFYDSVWWLANRLSAELPDEPIGIYAGANRSGLLRRGTFERHNRDALKDAIQRRELRLVIGTDAASEGLNLQRLGTLVNLDLPWNPSRLEQRKGRIQRIGQVRSEVDVGNMRYADSVEDRVHALLSERWEHISTLFGQLPDTLEDVWVQVALGKQAEAQRTIDAVPQQHPFALRYREVTKVDWESCARVLDDTVRRERLACGWRAVG